MDDQLVVYENLEKSLREANLEEEMRNRLDIRYIGMVLTAIKNEILLCRSMIWIPFFWSKMYGAILGFHFLAKCPKWTPASSSSWKFVLGIVLKCLSCFTFSLIRLLPSPVGLFSSIRSSGLAGLLDFPQSQQSSGSSRRFAPSAKVLWFHTGLCFVNQAANINVCWTGSVYVHQADQASYARLHVRHE